MVSLQNDVFIMIMIGGYDANFKIVEGGIEYNGKKIRVFNTKDASALRWGDAGVDYLAECTGAYLKKDACQQHLNVGAKKVLMSAPPKDDSPIFVMGVNHT